MYKKMLLFIGCCLSLVAEAGSMGMPPPPIQMVEVHPWSVIASIGYTSFEDALEGSGQTPLGRLAIAKSLCDFGASTIGVELGVQNGNTINLYIPQLSALPTFGSSPIVASVSPLLDLLADWKLSVSPNTPAFLNVKLGLGYRRMSILGRTTIGNTSQFAGEVQAGAGMPITETSTLSLLYQGIFGSDLGFTVDNLANGTGYVKNIPVQNSILLSLNVLLNS